MTSGTILHLQRLSTEDGPGIRTTVFFKGCPLRCRWCHNPESLSPKPQVQWLENRCIHCENCLRACMQHSITAIDHTIHIDQKRCRGCGVCAQKCPANAIELLGATISAEELLSELLKDRVYYEKSGGGVTLSGGEPTAQPAFAQEVLRLLKAAGISTALDTCGMTSISVLETLLPHVDLVLYDLKLADSAQHQAHTGARNERILENLRWLAAHLDGRRLWLRTPLIPGATASEENITALGRWIVANLGSAAERWELCAFNNLCRDKYTRLGLEWEYASAGLLTQAELDQARQWALASGVQPDSISITGAARRA